jgi:hypothetical protein
MGNDEVQFYSNFGKQKSRTDTNHHNRQRDVLERLPVSWQMLWQWLANQQALERFVDRQETWLLTARTVSEDKDIALGHAVQIR